MSRQAFAEAITYADEASGNLKIANSAEVSVFNAGTETLAKLYEARTGGALLGNPFILGSTAMAYFWTDSGDYDIKVHDTKGPARFGDFVFGWQSSPVNPSISEGDLSNTGDIEWTQELGGAWVPNLKANSVGANEILTGAVGSLELAEKSVLENKIEDKALTARKQSYSSIMGLVKASGSLATKPVAYTLIPGMKLEITPAIASKMIVTAFLDMSVTKEGAGIFQMFGKVYLDGADATGGANLNFLGPAGSWRETIAMSWELTLTAALHTIEIRAKLESVEGISSAVWQEFCRFTWAMAAS